MGVRTVVSKDSVFQTAYNELVQNAKVKNAGVETSVEKSVKLLTTNQYGTIRAVFEYILSLFGVVTPGSVNDLRHRTHALVKGILAKSDLNNLDKLHLSINNFTTSLSERVTVLQLKPEMGQLYALKLMDRAFAKEKAPVEFVAHYIVKSFRETWPVAVEPVKVQPGKTWARRTVEVASVAAVTAAVVGGAAYWAGYDLSILTNIDVSELLTTATDTATEKALVAKTAIAAGALATKEFVSPYFNFSLPSIGFPSLPNLPTFEGWSNWTTNLWGENLTNNSFSMESATSSTSTRGSAVDKVVEQSNRGSQSGVIQPLTSEVFEYQAEPLL